MSQKRNNQTKEETRREFLRKSVYAAYATPVITALLVSKASAAFSGTVQENRAECEALGQGNKWFAGGAGQSCCNTGPNDGCGPDG